ncbi:hypothetical protein ACRAWD_21815 [Caulobacter segnis]
MIDRAHAEGIKVIGATILPLCRIGLLPSRPRERGTTARRSTPSSEPGRAISTASSIRTRPCTIRPARNLPAAGLRQ